MLSIILSAFSIYYNNSTSLSIITLDSVRGKFGEWIPRFFKAGIISSALIYSTLVSSIINYLSSIGYFNTDGFYSFGIFGVSEMTSCIIYDLYADFGTISNWSNLSSFNDF